VVAVVAEAAREAGLAVAVLVAAAGASVAVGAVSAAAVRRAAGDDAGGKKH
jgi:hypothetical protein